MKRKDSPDKRTLDDYEQDTNSPTFYQKRDQIILNNSKTNNKFLKIPKLPTYTGNHEIDTRILSNEYLNCAHSSCPSNTTEITQSENAQLINNSSTSSGVTSDESEASFKSETMVAVNTIKYNAKTNILHEQKELRCSNGFRIMCDSGKDSPLSSSGCHSKRDLDYLNWTHGNSPSSTTPIETSAYSSNSNASHDKQINNNRNSPTLPFPITDEQSQQQQKQLLTQLNSSSSLTLVSKIPTSSYCYIDPNDESNKLDDNNSDKAIATGQLSSSSSGCSSLENQYYTKINIDKHVIKLKRVNRSKNIDETPINNELKFNNADKINKLKKKPSNLLFSSEKSIKFIETLNRQEKTDSAKLSKMNYQNFSTYKPLAKTSDNSGIKCSKISNGNNCNFKTSRIDYV